MRERRAGVWELIVQLPRDSTASRSRQLSRTVHGTKREAQRALAALVTEVSAGKVNSSNTTVAALLERWLDHVGEQLSPTTVREYRRLVAKRIGPDLGKLALRQVSAQRLDAYYVALGRDHALSPATIRHIHAVLRGSLGQAVRWGWIPANPAASASPPKQRRAVISPPGIAATQAILSAASEHDPDFGVLLRVLAATGARRGEVCGLRWSDLDRHARTLAVQRAVVSVPGGTVIKDTKTHADRRIAVDEHTLAALDTRRERQGRLAAACRVELGHDAYMFSTEPDGAQPMHPDTVTGGFRRICERLGLKGIRLHDLRHLHATQLLAAGVPVRTVSGRLGHANAATTLNVYAAFVEASDHNAASVIGNLLTTRDDRSATSEQTGRSVR
jgi:integrase